MSSSQWPKEYVLLVTMYTKSVIIIRLSKRGEKGFCLCSFIFKYEDF